MSKIVTKFGGSSLADAAQFAKVKEIIRANPDRIFVVPSAPGRRFDTDDKVTDLLYKAYRCLQDRAEFEKVFSVLTERYVSIADELNLNVDIRQYIDQIKQDLLNGETEDYAASRGEYLNGILLSAYLDFPMIDPKDYIFFSDNGQLDADATYKALSKKLAEYSYAVIPGFYGQWHNGKVKTFSRGGSDITGALVAEAVHADLYENWTDVCGFLMTDPRIVKNAKTIKEITYRELRELSYMGAAVLHEDSVFPVHRAGIPTNIRNTNAPDDPGTMISHEVSETNSETIITGIAGRSGFSVLSIEKAMMNSERGFGRKVLQAIEECGLSFEHMPTGIDTLCVVIATNALAPVRKKLISRIMEITEPDVLTVYDNMGIIATVGRGMVHNPGTAARLFTALSKADVNVRMIDQGSSELSILVGIDDVDFDRAIRAIYHEFVKD